MRDKNSSLTDAELLAAQSNLAEARASLACEGLVMSADQEALFRVFDEERLPHEERTRRIVERYAPKTAAQAAE